MASIHAEMHASMRLPNLKVRWRSGMTPDFELQDSNMRGFVGVRANHEEGYLESHDEVVEKPWRKEYVQAIVEGHLWAADEKTAKAAANFSKRPNQWRSFMAPEDLPEQAEPALKTAPAAKLPEPSTPAATSK